MAKHKRKNQSLKKSTVRPFVYFIITVTLIVINFIFYTIFARLFFNNNDTLWLSSLFSSAITTIAAYFFHSKITWRDRSISNSSIIRFFIWNLALTIAINPGFTWIFGLIKPLYQFIFNISTNINLPFDYDFIESTSIFIIVNIVIMIINYLFYDKFVFNKNKNMLK